MANFYDYLIYDVKQQDLLHYFNKGEEWTESHVEKMKPAFIGENDSLIVYNCYFQDDWGGYYGLLVFKKSTTDSTIYVIGDSNNFSLSSGNNLLMLFRGDFEDTIVVGLTENGNIGDALWENFPENKEEYNKLENVFNSAKYLDEFITEHDKYNENE